MFCKPETFNEDGNGQLVQYSTRYTERTGGVWDDGLYNAVFVMVTHQLLTVRWHPVGDGRRYVWQQLSVTQT